MVVAGFSRLRLTLTFPCLHAAPKNAADIGILSYSSFLLRILLIMIIMVMDEAKQEYVSEMYTRRLSVY